MAVRARRWALAAERRPSRARSCRKPAEDTALAAGRRPTDVRFVLRWLFAVVVSMVLAGAVEHVLTSRQLSQRILLETARGFETQARLLEEQLANGSLDESRAQLQAVRAVKALGGVEHVGLSTATGEWVATAGEGNPEPLEPADLQSVLSSKRTSWAGVASTATSARPWPPPRRAARKAASSCTQFASIGRPAGVRERAVASRQEQPGAVPCTAGADRGARSGPADGRRSYDEGGRSAVGDRGRLPLTDRPGRSSCR